MEKVAKIPGKAIKSFKGKEFKYLTPGEQPDLPKATSDHRGYFIEKFTMSKKIFNKSSRSPRVGSAFMNSKKLTTLAKY